MPPEDAAQPSTDERKAFVNWLRGKLLATQQPGVPIEDKLKLAAFGNYVDHAALFSESDRLPVYVTAHFGKWHMGGGRDVDYAPLPQAYGFDESLVSFEGLGDRIISNAKGVERTRALGHGKVIPCECWERMQIQTDRTIDFIRRHRDSPLYVRLFPNDVHDAHAPLPGSADKYKSVSDDPYVRNFFAVLEEMDKQIGRVVSAIDDLNLGRNTCGDVDFGENKIVNAQVHPSSEPGFGLSLPSHS